MAEPMPGGQLASVEAGGSPGAWATPESASPSSGLRAGGRGRPGPTPSLQLPREAGAERCKGVMTRVSRAGLGQRAWGQGSGSKTGADDKLRVGSGLNM